MSEFVTAPSSFIRTMILLLSLMSSVLMLVLLVLPQITLIIAEWKTALGKGMFTYANDLI